MMHKMCAWGGGRQRACIRNVVEPRPPQHVNNRRTAGSYCTLQGVDAVLPLLGASVTFVECIPVGRHPVFLVTPLIRSTKALP